MIRNENTINSAGFTIVELMISLFVAAAFIATGYQLYSVIISANKDARTQSLASNIARESMQKSQLSVNSPCIAVAPVTPAPTVPAGTLLKNPTIAVSITCPYGTSSNISKVSASVSYGDTPQQKVTHTIYATQ